MANLASMSTTDRIDLLLKLAVLSGASIAVKIRLRQKLNLNARDDGGRTILMLAAAKGTPQVCSLLIDAGADLLAIDREGRSAISIARDAGFASLANVLEEILSHHRSKSLADLNLAEPGLRHNFDPNNTIEPSEWEVDEAPSTPISDDSCINAIGGYQLGISRFVPVDTSQGWEDIRIKLPTLTHRRRRKVRFEQHQRKTISKLLRDGILNGCLPFWKIEETVLDINGARDEVLLSHLQVVLDDLGVAVEDNDYWNWCTVPSRSKLSSAERRLLRSAKRFFRDLATPQLDPQELYYRDVSVYRLLTHDEEIELGIAKDNAFKSSLAAAAQSESAIAAILEAVNLVVIGEIPLKRISMINSSLETENTERNEDATRQASCPEDLPGSEQTPANNALPELVNAIRNHIAEGHFADSQKLQDLLLTLHPSWNFIANVSKKILLANCSPETSSLQTAVLEGNEARTRLAISNLRLVTSIARTFRYHEFPISDLIQEGSMGLLRAIEKYDHSLGFRFSTYATWWIRQFMQRAICDQSRLIRIPYHIFSVVRKFNQTSEKLEGTSDMNNIACYLGVPIEIIERALEATREIHSLNEITDASEPNFEEPECQTAGPLDLLIQKCLFAEIRSLLFELATREREVLSLRFGLTGEGEQTLEEVGCVFGVTRERIRQIEKRALVRLSESSSTRKMQDYLESYTRVDDTAQHTEGTNTDAS